MKVALVGYVYWGINLAKTISANPNLELYSIFDLNNERINAAKECYKFKEFNTYDDRLKDDNIEAVFVATPPQTHYKIAYASLEAKNTLLWRSLIQQI